MQTGDGAHQVVVDPETAHRVVNRRIDPHRDLVRILVRDLLIHLEEVSVLLLDHGHADTLDGVFELQIHGAVALANPSSVVAYLLGITRGDVAWHEIPEARILALEIVVAFVLRYLVRRPGVALFLRDPDSPIVSQALAHQRELGLMIAADRNARWMDLRETGIGEEGAAFVRAPGCG